MMSQIAHDMLPGSSTNCLVEVLDPNSMPRMSALVALLLEHCRRLQHGRLNDVLRVVIPTCWVPDHASG